MVSFDKFDMSGSAPIYMQISGFIKSGIAAGSIKNGDEMPSRRVLSALLGVNPNTIQKAYAILEEEGLISSRSGAKSCVTYDDESLRRVKDELSRHFVREMVKGMKQMGLKMEQAQELIEKYWGEE